MAGFAVTSQADWLSISLPLSMIASVATVDMVVCYQLSLDLSMLSSGIHLLRFSGRFTFHSVGTT